MLRNLVFLGSSLLATSQLISPQSSDWNSTFSLTAEQIQRAGLDNETVHNVNTAARFERTNWAGGSVSDDPFYRPPAGKSHLPPGSLLKKQELTNTSLYALPPNTALSRIIFQSETFNGTAVPASAYILWPWMPRMDPKRPDKIVVVGWGHGLSGFAGDCAPSHIRNLWYQYSAPYILALQGYVVVAPDYVGLGVTHHADGTPIKHVLVSSDQGNDMIYAIQAAQEAFPELSDRFVLVGHSQGGHAVWAAARRLACTPVKGYLGTVSASPSSNSSILAGLQSPAYPANAFGAGNALEQIFPSFELSEWLTPKGIRYLHLINEIGGGNSVLTQLLGQPDLLQPNLTSTRSFRAYSDLMANSGKPFQGPMLVLQGTKDSLIPVEATDMGVNETCGNYPDSELEYVTFEGVEHVPVMYAGQRIWLYWIWERFEGKKIREGCRRRMERPVRPVESYQLQLGLFLEVATQGYLVA